VYKNLVAAIFRGIEQCASAMGNDAKTPHSMVRLGKKTKIYFIFLRFHFSFYLENYHQMQRKLNKTIVHFLSN
jgi:hypothetical protein